jgi:hypothetical protein
MLTAHRLLTDKDMDLVADNGGSPATVTSKIYIVYWNTYT